MSRTSWVAVAAGFAVLAVGLLRDESGLIALAAGMIGAPGFSRLTPIGAPDETS
jgi:hypothetical protein